MSIRPALRAARALQRRLQSRSTTAMRTRTAALRLRLARRGPARAGARWAAPAGFSAIERVMRRSAFHLSRHYTAHLGVQALLAAGITRPSERSMRSEALPTPALAAPAARHLERLLSTQTVLRERLVQRLTRTVFSVPVPRLAHVTRVELRQAAPRTQMTLVRTQVAAAAAAGATAEPATAAQAQERPAPALARALANSASAVLAPQELSRLTDHVIRQLDHRVLSWQERTGRA